MRWQSLFRKKSIVQIIREFQHEEAGSKSSEALSRVLNVFDLTMFGIAAVVGAGIFSIIGSAAFNGGPAIVVLFA